MMLRISDFHFFSLRLDYLGDRNVFNLGCAYTYLDPLVVNFCEVELACVACFKASASSLKLVSFSHIDQSALVVLDCRCRLHLQHLWLRGFRKKSARTTFTWLW